MEVTFADSSLDDLESDETCNGGFSPGIVRSYRKLMRYIRDSTDERDLRAWPGKRFEKLDRDRQGQHSMRINKQWRLVFKIIKGNPKNIIHIIEITDYHKG